MTYARAPTRASQSRLTSARGGHGQCSGCAISGNSKRISRLIGNHYAGPVSTPAALRRRNQRSGIKRAPKSGSTGAVTGSTHRAITQIGGRRYGFQSTRKACAGSSAARLPARNAQLYRRRHHRGSAQSSGHAIGSAGRAECHRRRHNLLLYKPRPKSRAQGRYFPRDARRRRDHRRGWQS